MVVYIGILDFEIKIIVVIFVYLLGYGYGKILENFYIFIFS